MADTIVRKYFAQPHYLKTADGRPIYHILDGTAIKSGSAQDNADFIALVAQTSQSILGVTPYALVDSELGYARNVVNRDGYSCLNYYGLAQSAGSGALGSYVKYTGNIASVLNGYSDKPFMACFMDDFAEKQRTFTTADRSTIRYLTDWSRVGYQQGLSSTLSVALNSRQGPLQGMMTLYAWNEWDESGYNLEPTDASSGPVIKDQMLADLATQLSLPTYGDTNCRTLGDCATSSFNATGTLTAASCTELTAWARDEDSSEPISVNVYMNGPSNGSGTLVTTVSADLNESSLPYVDKKHGSTSRCRPHSRQVAM